MNYVILAGGLGSRFVKEGYECPKPMIPLFGKPMIGVLIDTLMKNDADHIYVGANAGMPQLLSYLQKLAEDGLPVVARPIVTDNSYTTLKVASHGLSGRFIALTCDAVFLPDEFRSYREFAEKCPEVNAVMGLTRFVEDDSPLYARVSDEGEVLDYKYGGTPFEGDVIVSAGVYGLSDKIMTTIEDNGFEPESLSDFQRILASCTSVPVLSYEFSTAFDVDNTQDLRHAEDFLIGKL